jgi:ankyrin repeat protein
MKPHRSPIFAPFALVIFGILTTYHCGAKGGNTNTIQNAAWCGDIPRAKQYLAANPGLLQSKEGAGALDAAAQNGQSEMAAFLISQGADVNEQGFENMTPLARAASSYSLRDDAKSAEVAGVLITHGADIESMDLYGDIPLLHAVESHKTRVAEVLLQNSTNQAADQLVTYRGALGHATPLHLAIRENYPDMVAVLLKYQPPLEALNSDDRTPLIEAIYYPNHSSNYGHAMKLAL